MAGVCANSDNLFSGGGKSVASSVESVLEALLSNLNQNIESSKSSEYS